MDHDSAAARLRVALDLFEVGVQMTRSRIRRENPEFDEQQVEARVQAWLHDRPGAQFGDFPGAASSRVLRERPA